MPDDNDFSPIRDVVGAEPTVQTLPCALLTEDQVAQVLNVSNRTLQTWRLRGGGPKFVRISSRCIRYQPCDVAAYINQRIVVSTSDPGQQVSKPVSDTT